jgi:hypothetical protein
MQTIGGGDRCIMWVEVDMHVDAVGGAVGEIDRREGGFTLMAENRVPSARYWAGIKTVEGGNEKDVLDEV